eukprot:gene13009-8855_t
MRRVLLFEFAVRLHVFEYFGRVIHCIGKWCCLAVSRVVYGMLSFGFVGAGGIMLLSCLGRFGVDCIMRLWIKLYLWVLGLASFSYTFNMVIDNDHFVLVLLRYSLVMYDGMVNVVQSGSVACDVIATDDA